MTASTSTGPTYILDLQSKKTYEDVGGKKGLAQMGVSCAVLLDHQADKILIYREANINELLDRIFDSHLIVGINLRKFAYKILAGYRDVDFQQLNSLDILEDLRKKIVHKPEIEDVFSGTLGINQPIDNMQIARLFKEGKTHEVEQIAIQNARALTSLYSFGKDRGYVFLNDRNGQRWKISVSW